MTYREKRLRVYRYPLKITGAIQSVTPKEKSTRFLKPLSVGLDPFGIPSMWVLVEIGCDDDSWLPHSSARTLNYLVVGTSVSDDIPEAASFLGTVNDLTSHLIWHVFTVGI